MTNSGIDTFQLKSDIERLMARFPEYSREEIQKVYDAKEIEIRRSCGPREEDLRDIIPGLTMNVTDRHFNDLRKASKRAQPSLEKSFYDPQSC